MKLQFDPNQPYQQDAINAVINLFNGQGKENYQQTHQTNTPIPTNIHSIKNNLTLTDETLLKNTNTVQTQNNIPLSTTLNGRHFSIEMETGTGKTYVYLRTIYEINKTYGYKKFVIVVPSVAIREGVLKNLEITHNHFQNLYNRPSLNFSVYDAKRISNLRGYATNNTIDILVINIDAFAKDQNIINKQNDKLTGQKPIAFIQSTNPIVIVDEPQNMETDIRKRAIKTLNPLVTLRYSATHKHVYNLIYRLNPVTAYDLGLVKQIEVDAITSTNGNNDAFIRLEEIKKTKTTLKAKLTIDTNHPNGVKKKTVTIQVGDDIYTHTNQREIYKNGYIIEEIDGQTESITLSNGTTLSQGQIQGERTDEIIKFQLKRTIEEHLKKEKRLNKKGIKVLTLFFIDKVANYRSYDQNKHQVNGKFLIWFEDIYKTLSPTATTNQIQASHNGYFAQDKKGYKDTNGKTQADNDTYSLIMKDKERLLSQTNPLRFIFSHSALREGWDNPNVFQICTLNESKSEIKKRQEIGRGLRLAVDQNGNRTHDKTINRLTIIANESYEDFAKALQTEIEDDCGVSFKGRIKNKRNRVNITYKKGFELDPAFKQLWDKIKQKTTYQVNYTTENLIKQAANAIKQLPEIKAPHLHSEKRSIKLNQETGVTTELQNKKIEYIKTNTITHQYMPNIVAYIQEKTKLTNTTIIDILKQSNRLKDTLINPQAFLDVSINAIKTTLHTLMIDGITYHKLGKQSYEMRLFNDQPIDIYLDTHKHDVNNKEKTIYENYIPLDSQVESQFAKDCETSEQVQFYVKLPHWFKIQTPIGNYNPDWALIFKNEKKVYFVAETKSTNNLTELRQTEQQKIKCGQKHFEVIEDVTYKHITSLSDLVT